MGTTTASFLTWNDSWLVGDREIDNQHKHLFSLLNQLHQAMGRGQGKDVLGAILNNLVNYTKAHFSSEERLMLQVHYPDFAAHKREHDQLTKKVLEFQTQYETGGVAMSVGIMHFLSGWLQNHILGNDKKYSPFLRSNAG